MTRALVWGASGGIGRALVEALRAEDATVLAASRRPEGLADLTPYVLQGDASDADDVRRVMLEACQVVDEIDLFVYAAGDIAREGVGTMAPEAWARILGANLDGAFLSTHAALPHLAEDAHLIYLGAQSERMRLPGLSAYAAAKAGLEAFAATLAKEERGRRVTVVRPGAVDTPFWEKVPFRLPADAPPPEKVARRILEAHRAGEGGTLDLVA